jgi:hypothetical protein
MSAQIGDYLSNVGRPAQAVIPANNTNITIDSSQRTSNSQDESPSNFTCRFSAPLDAELLYYNHLHWNQPLFAHNNTNNELRFQLWSGDEADDPSEIMVVYAMPFVSYKSFDGRSNGTAFQAPVGFSYGLQMEYALNNDVRSLSDNVSLLNGNGFPVWKNDITAVATLYFRYSSATGYALWATKENGDSVSLRVLNCSWITGAHYVHGFGRIDPNTNNSVFAPNTEWGACYYAESIPTLLPYRFIVVASDVLTQQRKTQSISNATSAGQFKNEIAILPLNCKKSNIYHVVPAGNDTTTFSLRKGNQPYECRVSILSETGKTLVSDDPLTFFINRFDIYADSNGVISNGEKVDMFIHAGRPSAASGIINFLLFGSYKNKWGIYWAGSTQIYIDPHKTSMDYELGMLNADMKPEDVIHSLTGTNKVG